MSPVTVLKMLTNFQFRCFYLRTLFKNLKVKIKNINFLCFFMSVILGISQYWCVNRGRSEEQRV